MLVTALFVKKANIADLWKLDLIRIKDPIEKLSEEEQEHSVRESFLKFLSTQRKGVMRFIFLGGTIAYHYQITSSWLREDCIQQPQSYFLNVYMRTMR
ncbi:hypothetical protein CEXT_385531 [Caerostris extrusa]|uniref:Uncharacterized protein n=1 Tax=Caerostris extrusa TaxID=172846 RepID=A0AAV4RFG6_CAEEX|nr:hypothetical protein CEXT_385531 [Caerostris extrusa]